MEAQRQRRAAKRKMSEASASASNPKTSKEHKT